MSEQHVAYLIGLSIVLLFLFAAIRMMRRPPVNAHDDERMAAIERRLSSVEHQLHATNVTVQHLPTGKTVSEMAERISDVSGDVKALQASLVANNRLIERIDQYLLTKGA